MLLYVRVCVACMPLPCVGFVCFRPLLSVITSTFDTTQCSCWGRVRALRTLTTPRATTLRSKRILLRRKLTFGRSRLSRIDPPACALPQGGARVHLCSERASVISSAVMRDTKEPPGHPGLFLVARTGLSDLLLHPRSPGHPSGVPALTLQPPLSRRGLESVSSLKTSTVF